MQLEAIRIPRRKKYGGEFHVAIKCIFPPGDIALKTAFGQAQELAKKVHKASPSGRLRPSNEILAACICGLLSEEAFAECVAYQNARLGTEVRVHFKKFSLAASQVDVTVERSSSDTFDIEIRSSGHFKQDLESIYNKDFSIIGQYTTRTKRGEIHKPFYVQALYPFVKETIIQKENKEVVVYIAGGASQKLLKEKGSDQTLRQEGAEYRVITPITAGIDASIIIAKIMGVDPTTTSWD